MKTVLKELQAKGISELDILDTLLNKPEAIRPLLNQSPTFNLKNKMYKSQVAIAMKKLSSNLPEDFVDTLLKRSKATLFEVIDFYKEVLRLVINEQGKAGNTNKYTSMIGYTAFILKGVDDAIRTKGLYYNIDRNKISIHSGIETITRMLTVVNKQTEVSLGRGYKGINIKSDRTIRKLVKAFILEKLDANISQYVSYYKQKGKSQMSQAKLRKEVVNTYLDTIINYLKNPKGSLSVSNKNRQIGVLLKDLSAPRPVVMFKDIGLEVGIYTQVQVTYKNTYGYLDKKYSLRLSKELLERLLDYFSATTQRLDSTTVESQYTTNGVGIVTPKFRTINFRAFVTKGKDAPKPINRVSYTGRNLIEDGNKTKRISLYDDCVEFDIEKAGASIIGNLYADMLQLEGNEKDIFINNLKKIRKSDMRPIMNCKKGDEDVLLHLPTVLRNALIDVSELDWMEDLLTTLINKSIYDYREAITKFLEKRTPASNPLYISNGVVEYPRILFNKLSKGRLMAFLEQGYATYIVTIPQLVGYVYDAIFVKKDNVEEAEKELRSNIEELGLTNITFHKEYIDGV